MKERPIIFSAPMVRAILDGRKTQTRRVVTAERWLQKMTCDLSRAVAGKAYGVTPCLFVPVSDGTQQRLRNPWGWPDVEGTTHLWVRETYGFGWWGGEFYSAIPVTGKEKQPDKIFYKADLKWEKYDENKGQLCWCNCMYMPRFASRITLEITNIRVERLQELTEADGQAEGVQVRDVLYPDEPFSAYSYIEQYKLGWDSLNAKRGYSWESNPWVWVIEFRKVKKRKARPTSPSPKELTG